jgi:thiamine monophosphate synthase
VTPDRVQRCLDAGAEGVAVISAILSQSDLAAAVEAFQRVMRTL